MPRLRKDQQTLKGEQLKEFVQLLLDAYAIDSFTYMLRTQLDRRLEHLTRAADFPTMVFNVIEKAEIEGWSAELLQGARTQRQAHVGLFEFAQKFALEPPTIEQERIVKAYNLPFDPLPWLGTVMGLVCRICRVEIAGAPMGTGFLVGPDLVMTNYHVVRESVEEELPARFIKLRFDYKTLADSVTVGQGRLVTLHDTEWLVDASPNSQGAYDEIPATALDYALLRTAEAPGTDIVDVVQQGKRGWIPVPVRNFEFKPGTPLNILGHPQGEVLKLSIDTDSVLSINQPKTRIRYTTNTDPGSSGSPCFDLGWNLVALHHGGDSNYTANHKPQYNQGIPFSTIRKLWVEKLKGDERQTWQKSLLEHLLFQNQ
jgi:V8-like Glu-specific endopeptidase